MYKVVNHNASPGNFPTSVIIRKTILGFKIWEIQFFFSPKKKVWINFRNDNTLEDNVVLRLWNNHR